MKPINKQRRTILNSLSIAGAGSLLLPSEWSKPIVNSILLPAHAQTSVMLSIAGFSLTPDFSDFGMTESYQIDDVSNGVDQPELITVTSEVNANTITIGKDQTFVTGDNSAQAGVRVRIGNDVFGHSINIDREVPPEIILSGVPASVETEFLSNSGNTWRASYSVSVLDEITMVFDDIILTRV